MRRPAGVLGDRSRACMSAGDFELLLHCFFRPSVIFRGRGPRVASRETPRESRHFPRAARGVRKTPREWAGWRSLSSHAHDRSPRVGPQSSLALALHARPIQGAQRPFHLPTRACSVADANAQVAARQSGRNGTSTSPSGQRHQQALRRPSGILGDRSRACMSFSAGRAWRPAGSIMRPAGRIRRHGNATRMGGMGQKHTRRKSLSSHAMVLA